MNPENIPISDNTYYTVKYLAAHRMMPSADGVREYLLEHQLLSYIKRGYVLATRVVNGQPENNSNLVVKGTDIRKYYMAIELGVFPIQKKKIVSRKTKKGFSTYIRKYKRRTVDEYRAVSGMTTPGSL